jgi:nucleotide-binding universal stress UspA family protein
MSYRHLLVPTDGSGRSRRAIQLAVQLAHACRARITGLYVLAEGVPTIFSGSKLYASGVLGKEYRELAKREARMALAAVEQRAAAADVRCRTLKRLARHPWLAIVRTAHACGCDLIVMASHGRSGASAILLGSQTTKVLAHTRIAVLVCR